MVAEHATFPSLKGRVVLVTGGAEGIGASSVKAFARQGSKVCFFDISESSAERTIKEVKDEGHDPPTFYKCDVTNLDTLQQQAEKVISDHGTVDVLVNNAASAGAASRRPTTEVTEESWDFDIKCNLRHQFFLTKYLVPAMKKQGRGAIINLGSINWRQPSTGLPVYATSKAAVMGMTMTHSKEYGPDGIRVMSVAPGAIATERQIKEVLTDEYKADIIKNQSLKRILYPEEVANLIVFLGSDEASAITGVSYVCDGGWMNNL